jgi:uncharacterized membrane protein YpjA
MSEVYLLEKLRDLEESVKERTSGIKWAIALSVMNLVLNGATVIILWMIYSVLASHGAHAIGAAASSGTQQIAVIGGVIANGTS